MPQQREVLKLLPLIAVNPVAGPLTLRLHTYHPYNNSAYNALKNSFSPLANGNVNSKTKWNGDQKTTRAVDHYQYF
jgi:hypothetical protein